MTGKQKPPRVPNNVSGAYWQLAIHAPYDVAVAASHSGLSPVYIEDDQVMGRSKEPRWGVLDVSVRAEGDHTSAAVEMLRTFDTPQEAQEFAQRTYPNITGWGAAPEMPGALYPTEVSTWIHAEVAKAIEHRAKADVVAAATEVREQITALDVPVAVDVAETPSGTEAYLYVAPAPRTPMMTITVRAGVDGPTFTAELCDDAGVDLPPAGEWELPDAPTAAVLAHLVWRGPDEIEANRTYLNLPEASVADLAVAIATEPAESWLELTDSREEPPTVYSSKGCVACTATKRQLDKAGVTYAEVDVRTDQDALDRLKAMGYLELPVVVDGAEHWSGYRPDRVAALATKHAPRKPANLPDAGPQQPSPSGPGV